jgi:hypothetical protein
VTEQTGTQPGLPATWSTPKRLRAFRLVILALLLLLVAFGESTLSVSRSAFKTIGKDTVPSIIAAEEIGYALADLDANVANALLGNAQHRQGANATIERQRIKVTDALVDAAQNITYGDDEKIPIRAMTRDLGIYLERVAEARLHFEQGDEAAAHASYWQASDLLHAKLLAEATDLDNANKRQLEYAYRLGGRETRGAEAIELLLGSLLGAALIALEVFLYRKTRRILNGPLVASTALTAVLAIFSRTASPTRARASVSPRRMPSIRSTRWCGRGPSHTTPTGTRAATCSTCPPDEASTPRSTGRWRS